MSQAGGYRFEADKVQAAIKIFKDVYDRSEEDYRTAQRLLQTKPPGKAPETLRFHAAMQASHQNQVQEIFDWRVNLKNKIDNLEATVRQYQETEASNRRGLTRRD